MDIDSMLAEAAPARHLRLDGPDSPAAAGLYQRIIAQPPAPPKARRPPLALATLLGVAAAATAAAVALAVLPGSATAPRHGGRGGVELAAWSVVKEQDGVLLVTINELRDPAGLWRRLHQDGVPAHIVFRHHDFVASTTSHVPPPCQAPRMSDEANAELQGKIMPMWPLLGSPARPGHGHPRVSSGITKDVRPQVVLAIRPAAIPHGIGLFIEAWAASPGTRSGQYLSMQTELVLTSHSCTG
jgi:hypothetical protein